MKLINGNCLDALKDIPDGSIDFILTDPPYNTTACSWDIMIPVEPMWEQLHRVIKKDGAIALFGAEPFSSVLRCSNLKNYKYDWKWDKVRGVGHLLAKIRPMMCIEDIMIFSKSSPVYYPQMRDRDKPRLSKNNGSCNVWGGKDSEFVGEVLDKRYPVNLLTYSKSDAINNNYHPTQKPTDLLEYLINTYTQRGETVLDFTMGSGSTGVACINTHRDFIGIELNPEYYDIACKRIEHAQKEKEYSLFPEL